MKTIVYTTIFGESDSLKPAPVGADLCVCFVDSLSYDHDPKGWELKLWSPDRGPRREAWYLRCVPHLLFEGYDRVVWIDASFTLTDLPLLLDHCGSMPICALKHDLRRDCYQEGQRLVDIGQSRIDDIVPQLEGYRRAGFAMTSRLSIACVLVRDHSPAVQKFNETWDREIKAHPGDNTQVSLDYSAWKHGLTIYALQGTRKANPYASHDHLDHRRRRRAYRPEHVYVR